MEIIKKEPFIITEKIAEEKVQFIREKRGEALKRDPNQYWALVGEYSDKIKEKYSNWREFQLFNVLIGGTLRKERMPYLDFPSPDSVEEFIETLTDK